MVDLKECPICVSNIFETALQCKDHSISQEIFCLIRCSNCQLLITSPRPDPGSLSSYYQSDKYISHSDTSKGLINKAYHLVRKITLNSKIRLIKKYNRTPELLDIGSGAGYFLNHCRLNNITATGIEPDAETRNRSINKFDIKVYDEQELDKMKSSFYDVITLWHVLEHVDDLATRMNQIYRLLKPSGILIIALPNYTSYDARLYNVDWAGYDVPRHLWHFTPDTIDKLVNKYNLELFSILPMYFDAFYVSMLSECYKQSGFSTIRGLINGFLSNVKALIKKDNSYSSQIYLIRKKN